MKCLKIKTPKQGTEGRITRKMIDDIMGLKGREFPAKDQYNTEATRDNVRHYAEGIGDLNPLWSDPEYAATTHYGGIIAPPTFLDSCTGRVSRMGFPGIHAFYSGARWFFHKPVKRRDAVFVSGGIHDLVEKKSRFSRKSFLQTHFINYRNQDGDLVATNLQSCIRSERSTAADEGKYKKVKKYEYTEEALQGIWEAIASHTVRGADTRYWQDVGIGEELPVLVKGPLVLSDVIGFKMGWGSHMVHHIRANEARFRMIERHPGIPLRDTLNLPDVPEAVHMVDETSTAIGFPAWYDYGYQRVAWAAQLLTDWMGDEGWLKELDVQVRLPNIHGDTQWYKGSVTKKWVAGDEHLVECAIRAENQHGEVTAPGRAVVLLPSRN
jgi:acyl dehydratase